ncbi:MAG: OmpA/MotB domain protein precursor [Cereibacter sp.]|nr:OmpA/MotB domain protein precursor [Cereibacter sp.]
MRLPRLAVVPVVFIGAGLISVLGAGWAATVIEKRSSAIVHSGLLTAGLTFAKVEADGLQVWLTGTAPNEAARFRAVNVTGSLVDSARIRDALEVTPVRAIEAPRFSVEMLRNDDGISLIGLLPQRRDDEEELAEAAAGLGRGLNVADMLETADFPAPEGWDAALDFGLAALKILPRSKISVSAERVAITAISDSEAEKQKLEGQLKRLAPQGLQVSMNISAPRPVLTPFTLRFVIDEDGPRFDACSADTTRARDRIIAAGRAAGASGEDVTCTVGLGVPSPRWAEATEAAIKGLAELKAGSVTFSDADITLLGSPETPQADFDRVVGELEAALPKVFSLSATLPPKPSAAPQGPAEFTASLSTQGQVQLRGRLTDEMLRAAVDSFARAQFGASKVYTATRLDPELPDGWPKRVLAGLESLAQLNSGALTVRADTVEVTGVTGSRQASGRISQVLADKLGQGQTYKVSVRYDEKLDPTAALPTPQECAARINAVVAKQKIIFTPGSAEIDASVRGTLDALAEVFRECPDLKMEIAGHTDSQGSEGGNQALSQARAEAVVLALQGRRVKIGGLTAVGYGEANPIADNGSEEGREANRRIDFVLKDLPPAEPAPVTTPGQAMAEAEAAASETATGEAAAETAGDEAAASGGEAGTAEATDEGSGDGAAGEEAAGDEGAEEEAAAEDGPSVAPTEMTLRPKRRPDAG